MLAAADMRQVDATIAERLDSTVPLVGQVASYIISSGGKRLRPTLLVLTCGALKCHRKERFLLAAVIEFIHTATLLHDDVVDESTLRRGKATTNETFGNAASVLVGDFLHSRAFQMMVETGNMRIMQILAAATNVIAEGEVQQLMNVRDTQLDEAAYLQVIRSKTAKLFEASCQIAAILAGSTPEVEQACAEYGLSLGTAFQIIDDVLDYEGQADEMGKNLGDDLREGKVTLPLIVAMQQAPSNDADLVRQAIGSGDTTQLAAIAQIVRDCGGLDRARETALAQAQRATDALRILPDNEHVRALLELPTRLLQRRS